jgi:hypothetical protein
MNKEEFTKGAKRILNERVHLWNQPKKTSYLEKYGPHDELLYPYDHSGWLNLRLEIPENEDDDFMIGYFPDDDLDTNYQIYVTDDIEDALLERIKNYNGVTNAEIYTDEDTGQDLICFKYDSNYDFSFQKYKLEMETYNFGLKAVKARLERSSEK